MGIIETKKRFSVLILLKKNVIMLTTKKIFLAILLCSYASVFSQLGFGDSQKINQQWKFILQDNHEEAKQTAIYCHHNLLFGNLDCLVE